MNLHEFQGKELFAEYGLPVSDSKVIYEAEGAHKACRDIGGSKWVVKAQVHAGGRGKAGGVELVETPEEATLFAKKWLGKRLITYQTDEKGQLVNSVLIEECTDIAEELSNGKPSGDFCFDLEAFTLSTLKTKGFDIKGFSALMSGIDLTFEDLYVSYISKNVLNFFRQDNGYQDGSYKKVWSGKEDNEHLVELVGDLDKNSKTFKDNLYNSLQVRYTQRGL